MGEKVPVKRMSPAEFRELGFLQEVNRCFLHPLGLALEVVVDDKTGATTFGEVWDYRDDPEGMGYGMPLAARERFEERAKAVDELRASKLERRHALYGGSTVQPVADCCTEKGS